MHEAIYRPPCLSFRLISARVGRVQRVCVPGDLIQGWNETMGVLTGCDDDRLGSCRGCTTYLACRGVLTDTIPRLVSLLNYVVVHHTALLNAWTTAR